MQSSSRHLALAVLALIMYAAPVRAQQQAQGFGVERFYPSAPGAGWFVMDDLDLHGGLGGVLGLTLGYARDPLVVGPQGLAVVSDEAFADIGAAVTYRRWRFYLNLDMPLVIAGQSGVAGGYSFTAPSVNLGQDPDTLTDARFGTDVRIVGQPGGYFRFGASAQLFIPFGTRADYDTDDTFRAMLRALFAGDVRWFTYAAQLGVHIRPLDEWPAPGGPQGSELLFGAAGGARLPLGPSRSWAVVVGPEVWGATAFRSFFSGSATALEGILSGRIEGTALNRLQIRVKLGAGGGLHQQFGAPEWRLVCGVEVFNRRDPRRP